MYNYHADIVWLANKIMFVVIMSTILVTLACVLLKNNLWAKRRNALNKIKLNLSEIVLARQSISQDVCYPLITNITTEQFIDIVTNRRIEAEFFNDKEKDFFIHCFSNSETLSRLQKRARSPRNKWRRIEAILALGYTKEQSSIDILKDAISSKDSDVTYFSMVALGQIKNARAAHPLLKLLQKDPSKGYKIVSILESFPEEVSPEAAKLTDYHDPLVRYWALRLLSKMKPADYINQIEKLTRDPNAEVRAAACDCLAGTKDSGVSTALLKCMKDESWLVRSRAILALEKIKGAEALPEALKLINDASWSVLDAIREIMVLHIDAALPYIEKFLEGKDEVAKKYSVMALEDSGYILKLLTAAVVEGDKSNAMRLLKDIVDSRVRFGLDAAMSHLEPSLRIKAQKIVDHIGRAV